MEMRKEQREEIGQKLRGIYVDNILGYIFMAQQNNKELLITENDVVSKCDSLEFWDRIGISVMDIEIENDKFKKCEYINDMLIFEYDDRIIKIKSTQ